MLIHPHIAISLRSHTIKGVRIWPIKSEGAFIAVDLSDYAKCIRTFSSPLLKVVGYHSSAVSNSLSNRKVLEIKGKIQTNKPTTVIRASRKPTMARKPPVTSPS